MPRPENDGTDPGIDTTRPHPARTYDWLLGGRTHYPVDEELGRRMLELEPRVPVMAKVNRAFMHRATRWLAAQGIRQFLDIGSGIPTEPNLHQVARQTAPDARVVYCDNDPIVLAHAESLLHGAERGTVAYVQADARDTATILEKAAAVLDLTRPVGLSLIALLHFLRDEDGAYEIVRDLAGRLAPGSFVVISHGTADFKPEKAREATDMYKAGAVDLALRSKDEFARFFDGLDIVAPGISAAEAWHPELGDPVPGQEGLVTDGYVAVGRKP